MCIALSLCSSFVTAVMTLDTKKAKRARNTIAFDKGMSVLNVYCIFGSLYRVLPHTKLHCRVKPIQLKGLLI